MSRAHRGRVSVEIPGSPEQFQSAPLSSDWKVVGVIEDADGKGALVCSTAGVYCRVNNGVMRSLPQAKVKAAVDAARVAFPPKMILDEAHLVLPTPATSDEWPPVWRTGKDDKKP